MPQAGDDRIRAQMVALLPRLQRFAMVLTGSRADADDLVQATCERAIARLDDWLRGTALDSWMFKIAHNLHRNQRRDQANRLRLVAEHGQTLDHLEDGARRAEAWTELQEVRAKLLALPEEQRIAVTLIAIEGFSYQEAAALLEVPVGTVTSRLARARDALRAAIGTGRAGGRTQAGVGMMDEDRKLELMRLVDGELRTADAGAIAASLRGRPRRCRLRRRPFGRSRAAARGLAARRCADACGTARSRAGRSRRAGAAPDPGIWSCRSPPRCSPPWWSGRAPCCWLSVGRRTPQHGSWPPWRRIVSSVPRHSSKRSTAKCRARAFPGAIRTAAAVGPRRPCAPSVPRMVATAASTSRAAWLQGEPNGVTGIACREADGWRPAIERPDSA